MARSIATRYWEQTWSNRVKSSARFPEAWLSIGLICLLTACNGDHRQSFYRTLAEAEKDGATTRGGVPGLLPLSSRSIHEVHDLSPSIEWCPFEFAPADTQILGKNLKSVSVPPPSVTRVPSPGVPWRPAVRIGNLDVEKIHGNGFEIYIVERPATSVTTSLYFSRLTGLRGADFSIAHKSSVANSPVV
jgi:hypothetical protein